MNGLLPRAVLAFLALPGVVAFLVPLFLIAPDESGVFNLWRGFVPLTLGVVGLLWCVREFYVAGRGTLAPWSPPQALVVSGLYRFSRNPMYVAVTALVVGQGLLFARIGILLYGAVLWLCFHIFVIAYEEPTLRRTFGASFERYLANVPRWVPRLRPWVEQS